MRAVSIFHQPRGRGTKLQDCPQTTSSFCGEAESNRGPSAYRPNALPLGQSGAAQELRVGVGRQLPLRAGCGVSHVMCPTFSQGINNLKRTRQASDFIDRRCDTCTCVDRRRHSSLSFLWRLWACFLFFVFVLPLAVDVPVVFFFLCFVFAFMTAFLFNGLLRRSSCFIPCR